jgi:hypothetical protein
MYVTAAPRAVPARPPMNPPPPAFHAAVPSTCAAVLGMCLAVSVFVCPWPTDARAVLIAPAVLGSRRTRCLAMVR